MVTAELAAGLAVVAIVLGVGLQALALGVDEVRCADAARVAARAAARGDDLATVRGLAVARAPRGSTVTAEIQHDEALVRVVGGRQSILAGLGVPPAASVARVPVEQASARDLGG